MSIRNKDNSLQFYKKLVKVFVHWFKPVKYGWILIKYQKIFSQNTIQSVICL